MTVAGAEQSNSAVIFGDRLYLKLYRQMEAGVNRDLELGRLLTERAAFPHVPAVAGVLEYRRERAEPMTVGLLHAYTANEGDAWQDTLTTLDRNFEDVLARRRLGPAGPLGQSLVELSDYTPPALAEETIGGYLEAARLLDQRTSELHLALASVTDDAHVAPEPFTPHYQRSLCQSPRTLAGQASRLLRQRVALPPPDHQVLSTGRDFVIIDFEGEPARPLSERRLKRSPLRDVAGMLRSFDYAAAADLAGWGRFWVRWASATFLAAYLTITRPSGLLPATTDEISRLLAALLLEEAICELSYELNNCPSWASIPLQGILTLLDSDQPANRTEK